MARFDPKLIQQGETSTMKKIKHRGYTSFANLQTLNSIVALGSNLEQLTHRHEFIVYEDDTVEILPHLIGADFYNDTELTDELQKSQMNLDGSGANNSHGGISHTHDYVGFWPNGVVVENNIRGLSHKHKILGVPEKIQLIQPMYKTSDFKKMVSTHFEEFFQSTAANQITVPKFFQNYQSLFYDIPKEGENSHTMLIAQSSGYLTNYVDPSQQEVIDLTNRIVELEKELAEKDISDKEHPIFQNGSFLKHPDNATVYYMDKGQKRAIDNMEVFNILKRVNGHSVEEPNEEVIILVTEDVIKGLETGPKFRSEDLYGDEEKRKEEEEKKLIELDPDDFKADPSNYATVEDYLVALDRETRQLLAKEEYLQELFFRYKFDSTNLSDTGEREEARIQRRAYGGRLTRLRKQILRYTSILEAVDPDGNLQNLEISTEKLKEIVGVESARKTFTKDEMAQLGPKQNTIERFLDENKAATPTKNEIIKTQVDNSTNNTGTGLGNNTAAYLAASGMGEAAGYGAEEQPKSPPGRYVNNPTGLIKNHTHKEAIDAMMLGFKSSGGNWYWTFKVNNANKVVKGKETGQWRLYEQRLSNPILMGGAFKPNSRFNWKLKEFEWAPMPGKYPGVKSRIWEGKSIHKLKPLT